MRTLWPVLLVLTTASCAIVRAPARHPAYIVFFTRDSTTLGDPARNVIGQAAKAAQAMPAAPVLVLGYTDSQGSASADILLARARARHVAALLARDGIAPARIELHGRGQTHDDPGVESRRVEIRIGQ